MSAAFTNTPVLNTERSDGMAVRPLAATDAPAFRAMCARYPMRTLTPRLNLEAHGFQGSVVRSWGAFNDSSDELFGLLLRYGNTAVAVDRDGSCATAFARIIDQERNIAGVRGSIAIVEGIQALLRRYVPTDWENSYFLILRREPVITQETLAMARQATSADVGMLAELYAGAGAMYRSRANVAAKLVETRVFVVEEPALGKRPRRIASCALLNVEGSDAGLIGGVYTLPSARGKGYAAACTALLCIDLRRAVKLPCLFYENPIAGKVYRRLGFEDASRWGVLYLAPPGSARGGG